MLPRLSIGRSFFFFEGNTARETPAETLLKNKMEVKEYLQSSYEAMRGQKKRTERDNRLFTIYK